MTLAIRLFILFLVGLALAAACYFFLWPTPARLVGSFAAVSAAGRYELQLLPDQTAVLSFIDKKRIRYSYQGTVEKQRIVWRRRLQGKRWVDLQQPQTDPVAQDRPDQLRLREGVFNRITNKNGQQISLTDRACPDARWNMRERIIS